MDESDTDFDTVEIYCLDIVKRHFPSFIVTDITFFNIKLIFIRIVSNMFFFFRYQLFLVLLRNSLYPFRTTCSHFIPPENTTKDFLVFSGGTKWKHLPEISQYHMQLFQYSDFHIKYLFLAIFIFAREQPLIIIENCQVKCE